MKNLFSFRIGILFFAFILISNSAVSQWTFHGINIYNSALTNVGIGIISPTGKLHIVNSNQDASGNTLILGPTTQSNLRLGYHADYSWIQSHYTKPLAINSSGNSVGIGTTAPSHKLTVQSSDENTLRLIGSSGSYGHDAKLNFGDGNYVYLKEEEDDDLTIRSEETTFTGGKVIFHNADDTNFDNGDHVRFRNNDDVIFENSTDVIFKNTSGIVNFEPGAKVSIGTTYSHPTKGVLHVKGSMHVENSSNEQVFHVSAGKQLVFIGKDSYSQYEATQNDPSSIIQENAFSLWVSKGVVSEDFAVADVSEWDDYVFDEAYELPTLEKIAAFIKANKHLPNIPSEAEVRKNGYSMHQLNRGFLKTIEELTLHTIRQEEKINILETKIAEYKELAEEVEALKTMLSALSEK